MQTHLSARRTSRGAGFARRIAGVVALVSIAGCSHAVDVTTAFPAARGDSGAVEVVLNDPSRAVSVTIDDALVVERKHTGRVHVDGVPAGSAHVRVATGGRCEQGSTSDQDVVVTPGSTSTIVLPGAEPNLGCMVLSGLDYIGLEVGMVALAVMFTAAARTHVR